MCHYFFDSREIKQRILQCESPCCMCTHQSVHAGSVAYAHTCTLTHIHVYRYVLRFCIATDTIAYYAKVSGADSIAWWTRLHLTPALYQLISRSLFGWCFHAVCFKVQLSSSKCWSHHSLEVKTVIVKRGV